MTKLDLKKDQKWLYNPTHKEVTMVEVPEMNFIMIDGQGSPEGEQFQESIEALFPVAYTIKFDKKKADGTDFGVMALEGLWWAEDMSAFDPETGDRNKWQWTLMIMQPEFIGKADFEKAKATALKKKDNPAIGRIRFTGFKEGKAVQIMHIGPFATEGINIQRLHTKIKELGSKPSGKHHEIYLSDFRRVAPEKMKTVLRQPYL